MSWEAVQWANKQRMRSPQEQLVLLMIANSADPEGVAFAWWTRREHWWTYLVERTRISRGSVFRHLNTIESLGLGKRQQFKQADGSSQFVMVLDLTKNYSAPPSPSKRNQSHGETGNERNQSDGETEPVSLVRLQEEESPESKVGGGDDAREAPVPSSQSQAQSIADEIAEIAKVDIVKSPSWLGSGPAHVVQMWLDAGYTREHLIEGVRRAMVNKRDGPPHSINYFRRIWTRVRAEMETPIPQPEKTDAGQTQNIRNGFAGRIREGQDRQFASANERRFAQAFANVEHKIARSRSDAARDCGEIGPPAARGLSEPEKPA